MISFNWTTFALEILNFIVLVWLLARFLFRPVQRAIDARRASIEADLATAAAVTAAAEATATAHAERTRAWDAEREAAQRRLQDELAAQRKQALAEQASALDAERDRVAVLTARARADFERRAESDGVRLGGAVAARLLARAAGPALDAVLVERFVEDLSALSDEESARMRDTLPDPCPVSIESARPLERDATAMLESALARLFERRLEITWTVEPALLGGLSVSAPPWRLDASLSGELAWFAAGTEHD
jgi:F-type H+-transporting ATPase subunit b